MMEYFTSLMCVIFITLLSTCEGNDILSVMTHKVEFRTEAPAETPSDTPKDCYEYLYGRLSEIRRHGTTWTNGVSDCSNCTCDNGDIRCFFHFCNGPSTGYMTPPSAETGDNSSAPTLVESEDPDAYESSGFRPHDLIDDEDDVIFITDPKEYDYLSNHIVSSEKLDEKSRKIKFKKSRLNEMSDDEDLQEEKEELSAKWPAKVLPEKWQNELSTFETSSAPSASVKSDNELSLPRQKDKKDRAENETHDVFKSYFCGKPCKKSCPQGYKVDPVSGCWKCRCNRCPSLLSCTNKCPMGYSVDVHGCETCTCLSSELSNNDIVFKEDNESVFDFRDNLIVIPGGSITPRAENDFKWPNAIPEDDERIVTPVSTHLITPDPIDDDEVYTTTQDEPCNTTEPRGCLDGSRKFHVGGRWSRGPCVSCKCVAPGYSECNITQCHPLYACPHAHRYTPPGACCTLCKAFSALDSNDKAHAHESRSSSRIPTELLPPSVPDEEDFAMDESWSDTKQKAEDDATVKSLAKDDQSLLLLILIPMGVIFSLGIFLSTTMWRRYHRDKYDINSYRPDERQKLRPVKTLLDDQSSFKHV